MTYLLKKSPSELCPPVFNPYTAKHIAPPIKYIMATSGEYAPIRIVNRKIASNPKVISGSFTIDVSGMIIGRIVKS